MESRPRTSSFQLDTGVLLNTLDAVLIIGISIPCIYMASRIRQPTLRLTTVLLAGFLLFHGLYHVTGALGTLNGLGYLGASSDLFFEPVGWILFFAFAVYFARRVG